MIETEYQAFLRDTPGRYTVTGTSFVWCASPTLCGAFLWGAPTESETRAILRIFEEYPRQMAERFDIVLDSRGVERIDLLGQAVLFKWLIARRAELKKHLRSQANVIGDGSVAFTLTGLLPVAGWPIHYELHKDPAEAFRSVAGAEGLSICEEVESIAERLRGVAREVRVTRERLAERLDVSIDEVSRSLGVSRRSLQRILRHHGTSFHAELVAARLRRAQELILTERKISSVSAAVGVSERALSLMFKNATGLSPAEWRKKQR